MPDRKEKMNANTGGTTPRDANAAQRVTLAVKMRAAKESYDKIARSCGYADRGSAHKAVQRELQRVIADNIDELRREECVTLDLMQAECMRLFLDRNNTKRLFAADRLLAIMERRARLMGVDVAKDGNLMAAQIIIREVPQGYLAGTAGPAVEAGK